MAKYELLIPNLFLWMNIDLTPVCIANVHQPPAMWVIEGFYLKFNFEQLELSHKFGGGDLYLLLPQMSSLRALSLEKSPAWLLNNAGPLSLCSARYLRHPLEVKLGEASKESCSFGTWQIQ